MTRVGEQNGDLRGTPQTDLDIDILRPNGINMSLADAREILNQQLKGRGGICFCCDQRARRWRRDPTKAMILLLVNLYKVASQRAYDWQREHGQVPRPAFFEDQSEWQYWIHAPRLSQFNMMPSVPSISTFQDWGVVTAECSHEAYAAAVKKIALDPARAKGFYEHPNKPPSKGASRATKRGMGKPGYYGLTPKGLDFVEGKTKLPRFAHFYNEDVVYVEEEGPWVSIQDLLPGFDARAFARRGVIVDPDMDSDLLAATKKQRKHKANVAKVWKSWQRWLKATGKLVDDADDANAGGESPAAPSDFAAPATATPDPAAPPPGNWEDAARRDLGIKP